MRALVCGLFREAQDHPHVRLMYITDEQWAKSITVIGPNYDQGKRAKNPKVPNQVEFWD